MVAPKRAKRAKMEHAAPASKPEEVETGWEELEKDPEETAVATKVVLPKKKAPVLSKRERQQLKKDEEAAIRASELKRAQGESAPTSVVEFEALVLSSGDSSFVWVKYMAFLVSLGDVEKARALGHRALGAINYREDAEKFNIWIALLNLENAYGTEESTLRVLGDALRHTDDGKMYMAAIDVFERSGRSALLDRCVKAVTKKFGESPEVWQRVYRTRLAQRDAEGARSTLSRALQALPKQDHVAMISQAGLLEFRQGDPERGRSLFEGVLRNYPKRLDLWNVYIDQEIKIGEQPRIRGLLERATHLSLPPRKMKILFKRWLDYEKQHGAEADVDHVKRRAREFVESVGQ